MVHEFESGQIISFPLPADTPKPVIEFLNQLKETEEGSFHNIIAQLFINGVNHELNSSKPTVTIPLPENLTSEQKDWFNHAYTKQLLGNWICQLTFNSAQTIHSSGFELPTREKLPQEVQSENVQHEETIESNLEHKHTGFQVSTSYHAKLVGFFIEDQ